MMLILLSFACMVGRQNGASVYSTQVYLEVVSKLRFVALQKKFSDVFNSSNVNRLTGQSKNTLKKIILSGWKKLV